MKNKNTRGKTWFISLTLYPRYCLIKDVKGNYPHTGTRRVIQIQKGINHSYNNIKALHLENKSKTRRAKSINIKYAKKLKMKCVSSQRSTCCLFRTTVNWIWQLLVPASSPSGGKKSNCLCNSSYSKNSMQSLKLVPLESSQLNQWTGLFL